jgi:hypothetical protein
MDKVDFKRTLKHLYKPSAKEFTVVDVPEMNFLMLDGHGDPNQSPAYQAAVEVLYGMAYTLKFISKRELERDYVVPPLEGLWWMEDMAEFSLEHKADWDWTMMIMQPAWITPALVARAREEVARKKDDPPALAELRFAPYHEGLAVQILYVGPYDEEAPTIARLHAFAEAQGYALRGKHHEIYLSDPRRTAPERLKTVIRQPVEPA